MDLAPGGSSPAPPAHGRPDPSAPLCSRMSKPASIEDQVRLSYYTPTPQHYNPRVPSRYCDIPMGHISAEPLPSVLDARVRINEYVPGPGSYETRNIDGVDLPEGGRLNMNMPPVSVMPPDEDDGPPPNAYDPQDPGRPRVLASAFSKELKEALHIRQAEKYSLEHPPGPGHYSVDESYALCNPFLPAGGRCLMQTKPDSYFDVVPKLTDGNPGPDRYEMPGSIQLRCQSTPVWRHESATLAETKKLVDGICNAAGVTPGPGTYDLPDPPAIAGVPTLKSRKLPHGMPAPFAHNCSEDLSRNFIPFRQRNSSSLIFSGHSPVRSPSLTSLSKEKKMKGESVSLPEPRGEPEPEQPARGSSTRSLRRSLSAGYVVPPLPQDYHPIVEQAARLYPKLSGSRRKGTTKFLPMAARRCEVVETNDECRQFQEYHLSKKRLKHVGEAVYSTAKDALLPLDAEKLLQDSLKVLENKANSQLKAEGVAQERRKTVVAEMAKLWERPRSATPVD